LYPLQCFVVVAASIVVAITGYVELATRITMQLVVGWSNECYG